MQDSRSIAADVFSAVRPTGKEPELSGSFPQLTVEMRPYQRRAVGWMISREVKGPYLMYRPERLSKHLKRSKLLHKYIESLLSQENFHFLG